MHERHLLAIGTRDLLLGDKRRSLGVPVVRIESGGRLRTETLVRLRQWSNGRNGGILMLVLGLASRGQVLLQGVHVRRETSDLAKDVDKVKIQYDRRQMQPRHCRGSEPCGKQHLVRFLV